MHTISPSISRTRGHQSEGGGSEESDTAGVEWREVARVTDGHHQIRVAMQRSCNQEAVTVGLGDMAEDVARRETSSRNDSCL